MPSSSKQLIEVEEGDVWGFQINLMSQEGALLEKEGESYCRSWWKELSLHQQPQP